MSDWSMAKVYDGHRAEYCLHHKDRTTIGGFTPDSARLKLLINYIEALEHMQKVHTFTFHGDSEYKYGVNSDEETTFIETCKRAWINVEKAKSALKGERENDE